MCGVRMVSGKIPHDPIVIPEAPRTPVPYLLTLLEKPEIRGSLPPDVTYWGSTPTSNGCVADTTNGDNFPEVKSGSE